MLHIHLNLCIAVTSGTDFYQVHPSNQQKLPLWNSHITEIL